MEKKYGKKNISAFFRCISVMQNDFNKNKKNVKMTRASIGEHSICRYRMSSNVKQEKPQE